jgi:hypothetical protein
LDLGKICSSVAERKKIDKHAILIEGRFVDGLFNVVNGAARITQEEAKEIEKHWEIEEEKKKVIIRTERTRQMFELDSSYGMGDISDMNEEVWSHFLNGIKSEKEAKIEAERKAESDRIEAEKKRKAKEAKLRAENKILRETERIAAEILKKELDKAAATMKAEQEKQEAARTKEKAEYEKKLAKERKIRLAEQFEKDRILQELKEKQEDEAREKARIEKEKKEKFEESERLRLSPIKEQLKVWIKETEILDPTNSEMSPEVFEKVEEIMIKFNRFKIWANQEIDLLK